MLNHAISSDDVFTLQTEDDPDRKHPEVGALAPVSNITG